MRLGQEIQALPRSFELSAAQAIHVVAGILRDAAGRILITQRLPGQHMAGRWEFPGGKLQAREAQPDGLARELVEELGVAMQAARPLIEIHHRYPDRAVVLHVWSVERYSGHPVGREGQALQWLAREALPTADLLEADRPILAALALPERYLITGEPTGDGADFLARLEAALARGIELVQLRAPRLSGHELAALARPAAQACRAHGAALMINGDPRHTVALALELGAAGIHVPARFLPDLAAFDGRHGIIAAGMPLPRGLRIGASCHDASELVTARAAGATFAVLGPVRATPGHPGVEPLGWDRFATLARGAGLPVYALGGLGTGDLSAAWAAGAQGIAAIRSLWEDATPPR